MKRTFSLLFQGLILIMIQGCVVTNLLYNNNGHPSGKGNMNGYAGVGMGLTPKLDSIGSVDGRVYLNERFKSAPILSAGIQAGIGEKSDLRAAVHIPYIIGGFGLRVGLQHSFFDSSKKFNVALGMDYGYVFSRDSFSIFGGKTEVEKYENYALNADYFLPLSYRLKNESYIILTPRYSFTGFNIFYKENIPEHTFTHAVRNPVLSLGIKSRRYYFEASALKFSDYVIPQFGFTFNF